MGTSISDNLKRIYEVGTKDQLGWYTLRTIITFSKPVSPESIQNKIYRSSKHLYTLDQIKMKLNELSSDNLRILRYNSATDNYQISTPFWGAFLKMKFMIERNEQQKLKSLKKSNLKLRNLNDPNSEVELTFLNLFKSLID